MTKMVTRIAPSPTGRMHVGTARTALFNFLLARHHGGRFIVRIEDTDPTRDKPEFEKDILDNLAWLGIEADEIHHQSHERAAHVAAIEKLVESGNAYVSKEPSKNDATVTAEIVRFKNPNRVVNFTDLLHGDISVDTTDLKDFVIARSKTEPVHHLAVVVDDQNMGVTLAMRGEDLLSNTPRQILIQDALGLPRPAYAHLPLILAPDRTKLSKRRHAVSIGDYRARGYLPAAMVNFLAFLGWNPGGEQELFSMQQLIAAFDIPGIQKSPAVFNEEKLKWFNREYLKKMDDAAFAEYVQPALGDNVKVNVGLHRLLRERIATTSDIGTLIEAGELDFLGSTEPFKGEWMKDEKTAGRLQRVNELLDAVSEGDFMNPEAVKAAIWDYATEEGRKNVLQPMREILSGKKQSPDPFTIASVLGKREALARLAKVTELLH